MTAGHFRGEKFKSVLIQEISDVSCKAKGDHICCKEGCKNVRTIETHRTGEDLFFAGDTIPPMFSGLIEPKKSDHSFELTTRTHKRYFEEHTWGLSDEYNIPERRIITHYGYVKPYTAYIEFPWLSENMEEFCKALIKPSEMETNGGRGPGISDLDAERRGKVEQLLEKELDLWIKDGCRMVMVLYPDILHNYKTKEMAETRDPNSPVQSKTIRMLSSQRHRFKNFERVFI